MRKAFVIMLGLAAPTAAATPVFARGDVPAGVTGSIGTGSGMGTGATSGVIRGGSVTGATPGVTRRDESTQNPQNLPAMPDTPTTIDRQTGLSTAPSAAPSTREPQDPREALSPRVRARQSAPNTAPPDAIPPSGNVTAPAAPRPTR
ncbi:MAG TPA: hypothetical protein VGL09_06390 [Methylomirabilota bacterium]|jgi:hypothetical protein